LDGDGDTDVLSASIRSHNQIAWYESDGGSPPSFTERAISTSLAAVGAESVFATDVDGDGYTDVLSASASQDFGDKIAWYESDGGSPPSFTERVISITADGASSVFATDVDGDGDIDVLSASTNDDKIAWYESDGGSPPSFTEHLISTAADIATSVFATDVDGDGDTDVLSASWGDNKIAWYENNGGSPPTFIEWVISSAAPVARSIFAADVDGDGDIDVLSASEGDDKVAWYENTTLPPPIPAVSQWGLITMSLLMLTAGTLIYRTTAGGDRIQYYHRHVTAQLVTQDRPLLVDAEPQKAGDDELAAAIRLVNRVVQKDPRAFDVVAGDAGC